MQKQILTFVRLSELLAEILRKNDWQPQLALIKITDLKMEMYPTFMKNSWLFVAKALHNSDRTGLDLLFVPYVVLVQKYKRLTIC